MRTVLDGQTGIAMLLQDTLMGEMDKPKLSAGVMVLEPDSEKSRPQTATSCLALPCSQSWYVAPLIISNRLMESLC